MRLTILSLIFVCPLFTIFSLAPSIQTEQSASSDWLTLLRLSDCELPCWIGIMPGETTVGEAEERVATAFADTSLYQLEKPVNFWPGVIYKPTGSQLNIAFFSDNGKVTEDSIVQFIFLDAFTKHGTSVDFPEVLDLQSVLGEPAKVRLGSGADNATVGLSYRNGRVTVAVDDLECDQVLPHQKVLSISLYGKVPSDTGWLSDPQDWRGFGYCYNFERKLSS